MRKVSDGSLWIGVIKEEEADLGCTMHLEAEPKRQFINQLIHDISQFTLKHRKKQFYST